MTCFPAIDREDVLSALKCGSWRNNPFLRITASRLNMGKVMLFSVVEGKLMW
ncbi:hypothetical protein [Pedobacter sp.]|uniref:hypothetical protein n=1 Tax=Pedobacter sp. TaxID=1411316 RepID=UPI0031CF319D